MTIIWCMVPEIWSASDILFYHSRSFFALLPPRDPENQYFEKMKKTPEEIILQMRTKNESHMMYGPWEMKWNGHNFLSFWSILCPFTPPNNPKNQNFEKWKKQPGDITILHMCTINDNHMIHGSWNMERDRQNFLSLWTIFCPFTPLTTIKIKILWKWKKSREILSYYNSVPKIMTFAILFLRYGVWQMYLLFFIWGYFLTFYPSNSPKNQN